MILSQKKLWNVLLGALTVSLVYAILRYNIFNDVPWKDLPIFVLNKAVSLTIIILLFYDQFKKNEIAKSKSNLWFTVLILTMLHFMLSTAILIPDYFGKFYDANQLNIVGSLSLLFGILAFVGFLTVAIIRIENKLNTNLSAFRSHYAKIKLFNFICIGTHLFVMGISGWLIPSDWPAYLPPISLIAFVLLLSSIFILIIRK